MRWVSSDSYSLLSWRGSRAWIPLTTLSSIGASATFAMPWNAYGKTSGVESVAASAQQLAATAKILQEVVDQFTVA